MGSVLSNIIDQIGNHLGLLKAFFALYLTSLCFKCIHHRMKELGEELIIFMHCGPTNQKQPNMLAHLRQGLKQEEIA